VFDAAVFKNDIPVYSMYLNARDSFAPHPSGNIGNVFHIFDGERWDVYWHIVDRGLGCQKTSYSTQDSFLQQVLPPSL
jgi:hypothetical protein